MRLVPLALVCALTACGPPPRTTAEGAVAAFLAASDAFGREPSAQLAAYSVLCGGARAALRDAAARATALGLPAKPEQMLVPRWSTAPFAVERMVFDGRGAVDLYGIDPRTQHARLRVAEEDGAYCVLP